jgi:hypothetical protein
MKKIFFFLFAVVLCFAACKKEPDLPDDPHFPLINPFIGVWKAGGEYWQFRTNGTGGRAVSATGPFSDTFSFFVYAGQDVRTTPSEGNIVIIEGTGSVSVTNYNFVIEQNQAYLTSEAEPSITMEKVNGVPAVLNLTNPLIGEWTATWSGTGIHVSDNIVWSLKYRTDGTVKTYHHGMHQFENGYALRGDKLVIFGIWRFNSPVIAEMHDRGAGKWHIMEISRSVEWNYTKVESAEWK